MITFSLWHDSNHSCFKIYVTSCNRHTSFQRLYAISFSDCTYCGNCPCNFPILGSFDNRRHNNNTVACLNIWGNSDFYFQVSKDTKYRTFHECTTHLKTHLEDQNKKNNGNSSLLPLEYVHNMLQIQAYLSMLKIF